MEPNMKSHTLKLVWDSGGSDKLLVFNWSQAKGIFFQRTPQEISCVYELAATPIILGNNVVDCVPFYKLLGVYIGNDLR